MRQVHHLPSAWLRISRICPSHRFRPHDTYWALTSTPRRTYATHRESISGTSSLLSQALDQRQKGTRGQDNAGPFQLGMLQTPLNSGEKVKKWDELSTGGKVMRGAARSSNFTVILFGAGLTAVLVYALTSELFSRNSPTVLYGEACDRIKASPNVARYLQLPISFHNNPPSSTRPRHRNHHVSSQLAVDSSGREHMLLNFYVRGSRPGSDPSQISEDDSYLGRAQATLAFLSDVTWVDAVDWTKDRYHNGVVRCKNLFLYLTGQPLSPPSSTRGPDRINRRETEIGKPVKEVEGSLWSFAGLFAGLRSKTAKSEQVGPPVDKFEEGEVHADLVKDENGNFIWRYILIDLPYSRSWRPTRIFVEKSPDVRDGEGVMKWH